MSEHTPGPWVTVEANEKVPLPAGLPIAIHRADEPFKLTGCICSLIAQGDGKYDPEVTAANARLIAAAPELLAAAKAAREELASYYFGFRAFHTVSEEIRVKATIEQLDAAIERVEKE